MPEPIYNQYNNDENDENNYTQNTRLRAPRLLAIVGQVPRVNPNPHTNIISDNPSQSIPTQLTQEELNRLNQRTDNYDQEEQERVRRLR